MSLLEGVLISGVSLKRGSTCTSILKHCMEYFTYLERYVGCTVREDLLYAVCSLHRNRALLHDNLWLLGNLRNLSRCGLNKFQIRRSPLPDPKRLCRCVNGDENQISFDYCRVRVGGEEEVFPAKFFNNFLEAWFVYRESVRVPGIDTRLTEIHHCHLGGGGGGGGGEVHILRPRGATRTEISYALAEINLEIM